MCWTESPKSVFVLGNAKLSSLQHVRGRIPLALSLHTWHALSELIASLQGREQRWIEREGERFSPSVGLVLLQGESFKILPPMWLLVFTLMTPLLPPPAFLPHDFPGCGALSSVSYGCSVPMHILLMHVYKINNACLLTGVKAISDQTPDSPSDSSALPVFFFFPCLLFVTRQQPPSTSTINHAAMNQPTLLLMFPRQLLRELHLYLWENGCGTCCQALN